MTPTSTRRMMGIPAVAMPAVHAELARGRSAAEAADLARRVGYAMGPSFVADFEAQLASSGGPAAADLAPEIFWSRLAEYLSAAGWGELEVEETHPGVVTISAAAWSESTGRRTSHPSCHLSTGALASIVSGIAGTELAVLESGCRASGAERCTFLVGGQAALSEVYSRIREGMQPARAVAELG